MLLKVGMFLLVIAEVTAKSVNFENMSKRPVRKCREKPMPNFPGRISEKKCEQYLWEKKERIRKEKCINTNFGIINGISSNITEFPHMAAIGWESSTGEWSFKCGGSLISHNFVLTAAHCTKLRSRFAEPKIVRLGATIVHEDTFNSVDKPIDIKIKRILRHPKYRSPKKYFDIALFELSEKVNFTNFIQPACLSTEPKIDTSQQYFVTGWGQIAYRGSTLKDLQSAEIKIVENCENHVNSLKNRNWRGLQDQICAGGDGTDTCQGDSGGPLQFKISKTSHELDIQYMIVGITAFGKECGISKIPGIYTKVFNFIDWIEKEVWPETRNSSEDQTLNDNTNNEDVQLSKNVSSQTSSSLSATHNKYDVDVQLRKNVSSQTSSSLSATHNKYDVDSQLRKNVSSQTSSSLSSAHSQYGEEDLTEYRISKSSNQAQASGFSSHGQYGLVLSFSVIFHVVIYITSYNLNKTL